MSAVSGPPAASPRVSTRVGAGRLAPLARGAVAIALGVVITFSSDHSARFGLLTFAIFALATAVPLIAGAIIDGRAGTPGDAQRGRLQGALAVVAIAAGLSALLVSPEMFVTIVSAWALMSGAAELGSGIAERRAGRPSRDAIILGAVGILFALILLIVPPDYAQPWQVLGSAGDVEAEGSVTADIMTVGFLGAWAVIHGVLIVISALTPAPTETQKVEGRA